jgi:HAD superfamily hydrolase (TIGR01509 family)
MCFNHILSSKDILNLNHTNMKDIFDYNLYLFDLDGTVINSEQLHWKSYQKSFQKNNIGELTFQQYIQLAHSPNINFKSEYKSNYSQIYTDKEQYFEELINELELIDGAEKFLNKLFELGKDICIVTHSNNSRIEIVRKQIPFLNKIFHWIGYENHYFKKPNPEAYVKAINLFKYPMEQCIAFEDSLKGYIALENLPIQKVLIQTNEGYPLTFSSKHINKFNNYHQIITQRYIYNISYSNLNSDNDNFINVYINQLQKHKIQLTKISQMIASIIKNTQNNVYLTGIGKSGYVCQKSCSTWRCMGLQVNYIDLLSLYHGEFGIFKPNDIIIYISKSGNTDELIRVSQHLKQKFNVMQILISSKKTNNNNFNLIFTLGEIQEIDKYNCLPTTSSTLFMILLDMIGALLSKIHSRNMLNKYHPGGTIGKITKPIDCVVIYACGKGTRLYPITKYIPKVLVNINNDNMLSHIIKYWYQYTNQFCIVIESKYNTFIEYYMDYYKKELDIDYTVFNVDCDEILGNSYTIIKSMKHLKIYNDKKVLFTWCDICPGFHQKLHIFGNHNVIFTYRNQCRYMAKDNKITKNNHGNIIGIYYFSNFQEIKPPNNYTIYMDLCDIYHNNYNNFITFEIEYLVDIGDLKKLDDFINEEYSPFKTRFFNKITQLEKPSDIHHLEKPSDIHQLEKPSDIHHLEKPSDIHHLEKPSDIHHLKKESICQFGNNIIDNEMKWYRVIGDKTCIPKIYEYNDSFFIMEKITGKSLYQIFWKWNLDKQLNMVKLIKNKINEIHSIKTKEVLRKHVLEDINIELNLKIRNRIKQVKKLINGFGDFSSVNNQPLFNYKGEYEDYILEYLNKIFIEYFGKNLYYYPIHGDPQFSNMIFNENTNSLYFIDPRGYFGNSKIYGPIEYDYAKILYALSGYDKFNNDNQKYFIEINDEKNLKNLNLNIENHMDDFLNIITNANGKIIPKEILIGIVIINWLGLTQYCQNDVLKCVSSYYYGIYLFIKYFGNYTGNT